jgi:hypothetical protein
LALTYERNDNHESTRNDTGSEEGGVPFGTLPRSDRVTQPAGESGEAILSAIEERSEAIQSLYIGLTRDSEQPDKRTRLFESDGPRYDSAEDSEESAVAG